MRMDDIQIGRTLRRLRQERDWTQSDAAKRAGVSRPVYSRIECGRLDGIDVGDLRRVAGVLETRLAIELQHRGGELARMLAVRHALMTERVGRLLTAAGWEIRLEVSFNHFGERGVIDLVAWHPGRRVMLLIELKTELIDLNQLLATHDRRRRLAAVIAAQLGWQPAQVSTWLVLAESRTNRRRVSTFRTALRSAFPIDGRRIPAWLRDPTEPMAALWFLPSVTPVNTGPGLAPRRRVTRAQAGAARAVVPAI